MKILLGVSGSISAYKTIDLARLLIKSGHEVKVVLTTGALKFVVPNLFTYLGVQDVYFSHDDFTNKNVLHVDLARWSDVFVIAPLSANTLSRLAQGQASDLLSSIFLALEPKKNILLFPAMNTHMLHHPFTKENLEQVKKISSLKNIFISPTDTGILACEEIGEGKLPSVEEIAQLIPTLAFSLENQTQKTFLVTTGATIVPLDPVRYLTNSSSGVTGYHFAETALSLGHKVNMIAGINATPNLNNFLKHPNYQLTRVKTVDEMHQAVMNNIGIADLYVSSAAISDIEFNISIEKIKKESLAESLPIKKAVDILKSVIELKLPHLKIVGFAAETNPSDDVLAKKMLTKPVDLLIATKVNNGLVNTNEVTGFNVDHAYYRIKNPNKFIHEGDLSKKDLALKIIQYFYPPQ